MPASAARPLATVVTGTRPGPGRKSKCTGLCSDFSRLAGVNATSIERAGCGATPLWKGGARMSSIAVGRDGSAPIELYCEDRGNGRPVVLVHGWPLSGASWEKQTTALVDAGYRAIVYDRRGFGRSSKPATGYDFDTLADDLHKVLTHLDLRGAVLIGFGMGTGEVARYVHAYGSRRVLCAAFIAALLPHLPRTADNPSGVDPAVLDGMRAALVADRARYLSTFFSDFCNDDALGDRVAGDAIRLGWDAARA